MAAETRHPTILIAEDYDDNRELLRVLLASANYNVSEARNGRECLELAKQYRPDLIMVDLSMPVLDGWALLEELKRDALTARIPCVAVTAHGESDRERALSAGFDGYVSKPFHSSELYRVVRLLLESVCRPQVC
jgi:two-component system cell cycle response regulator DivK